MSVVPVDLTLASATLAGGAVLASAGSGLPARITTEPDYHYDAGGGIYALGFSQDELGIICVLSSSNTRRIILSSGSNLWSTSTANSRSFWYVGGGKIYMGREFAGATTYYEIDETTGALTTKTKPANSDKMVVTVPGGTADRMWNGIGTTTISENVISTGLASGRTITPTGTLNLSASNWDGTPSIYVQTSGTLIQRYNESTLALVDSWTVTVAGDGPGGNMGNSFIVDPQGRLIVQNSLINAFDRLPNTGHATLQTDTRVERIIWASQEIRGGNRQPSSGGAQQSPSFALSPTGRYFAFSTVSPVFAAQRYVTVRNVQDQTVEWTTALNGQAALRGLEIPGNLGNGFGVTGAIWRAGTAMDHRRAKGWYQRIGVDGSKVYPQDGLYVPLAGLSLVGASALKIGFDLNDGFGKPGGPAPYIGGPTGEGPRLWLEGGRRRGRIQGAI